MSASYPTSAKAFTTKTNGASSVIDADHVNDLQLEVTAIETDLIAGLPVARGGTGALTHTSGSILIGAGTSAITSKLKTTVTTQTATRQIVISGAGAGQVVFPATQNDSTNANTLDDYEKNSWTPTIVSAGGGTATYT